MMVNMTLRSIYMTDEISNTCPYIFTSEELGIDNSASPSSPSIQKSNLSGSFGSVRLVPLNSPGSDEKKKVNNLATISYRVTKDGSPDFDPDAQTAISAKFTALSVFVACETLNRIITLLYEILASVDRVKLRVPAYESSKSIAHQQQQQQQKKQEEEAKEAQAAATRTSVRGATKVSAQLDSMALYLLQNGSSFASAAMLKMAFNMLSGSSKMEIRGEMGNLIVNDDSILNSRFKKILGIQQKHDSLINFSFITSKLVSKSKEPIYNKTFKANISSIRFVYLQKFVDNLKNYVKEGRFLDALKEGSKRATKKAKAAVENLASNIELLRLDVKVSNPTIIVPRSSDSIEGFAADLGNIAVSNSVSKENATWRETIRVELANMNVKTRVKALLDEDKAEQDESQSITAIEATVLENTNIDVGFTRNVLGSGDIDPREFPSSELRMDFSEMQVQLAEKQYNLVFGVLEGNVNAGKKQQQQQQQQSSSEDKKQEKDSEEKKQEQEEKDLEVTSATRDYTTFSVAISFPKFRMALLKGNGLTKDKMRLDGIADLSLRDMFFSYRSNKSKATSMLVSIKSLVANDIRPDSAENSFTQFVTSEKLDGSTGSNFLNMTMETKADQNKNMRFELGDPNIVFIPPVILGVKDFFVKNSSTSSSQKSASQNEEDDDAAQDLFVTCNTFMGEDFELNNKHRLIAETLPYREIGFEKQKQTIVLDGQGNTIHLQFVEHEEGDEDEIAVESPAIQQGSATMRRRKTVLVKESHVIEPLIVVGDQTALQIRNAVLRFHGAENIDVVGDRYFILGTNSNLLLDKSSVKFEFDPPAEKKKEEAEDSPKEKKEDLKVQSVPSTPRTPEAQKKGPTMEIVAMLGNPKVIFPEDLKNKDSRYIILEMEADTTFKQSKTSMSVLLKLKRITGYVGFKGQRGAAILDPISIDLEFRKHDDANNSKLVQVSESNIALSLNNNVHTRISYQDLKTIQIIASNFSSKKVEEKAVPEQIDLPPEAGLPPVPLPNVPELSKASKKKTFKIMKRHTDDNDELGSPVIEQYLDSEKDFSLVFYDCRENQDVVGNDELEAGQAKTGLNVAAIGNKAIGYAKKRAEAVVQTQTLNFSFVTKEFAVSIVDDIRGYDIPLINFFLKDALVHVYLINKTITASLNLQDLAADYYNLQVAVWEPFIERYSCMISYIREAAPEDHKSFVQRINFLSLNQDKLNVNVTRAMVEALMTTAKLWKEGFYGNKMKVSTEFQPYKFRNHTGWTLFYSKDFDSSKTSLDAGREIDFSFRSSQNVASTPSSSSKNASSADYLSIQLDPSIVKGETICVSKVGLHDIALKSGNGSKVLCKIEIELVEGKKIVTIRSSCKLVNKTTEPLEIKLIDDNGVNTKFISLNPGASEGVPFSFLTSQAKFSIRPIAEQSYAPSEPKDLVQLIQRSEERVFVECRNKTDPEDPSFNVVLLCTLSNNSSKKMNDFTVDILPPFSIENLFGCGVICKLLKKQPRTPAVPSKKGASSNDFSYSEFHSVNLKRGSRRVVYTVNPRTDNVYLMIVLPGKWDQEEYALVHRALDSGPVTTPSHTPMTPSSKLHPQENSAVRILDTNKNELSLNLDYKQETDFSFKELILYSPYWLVNQSGLNLTILYDQGKKVAAGQDYGVLGSEPLMFSFPKENQKKICFRIESSQPSKGFSIDNAGTSGSLDIDVNQFKRYHVGIATSLAPGKFKERTKVVTFTSRWVLFNRSGSKILVRQHDSGGVALSPISLDDGKRENFYWPQGNKKDLLLEAKLEDDQNQFEWSSPFSVELPGEVSTKSIHSRGLAAHEPHIFNIQIMEESSILFVIFEKNSSPPYEIHNNTKEDLVLNQIGTKAFYPVAPGKNMPYSWDDNSGKKIVNLNIAGVINESVELDQVSLETSCRCVELEYVEQTSSSPVSYSPTAQRRGFRQSFLLKKGPTQTLDSNKKKKKKIYISVQAVGPTRVLYLSYTRDKIVHEQDREVTALEAQIKMNGIGLSLSDAAKELIYVTVDDIFFSFVTSNIHRKIEAKLSKVQIDNQMIGCKYPVMFHPASKTHEEIKSFLYVVAIQNTQYEDINYFEYFSVLLQQCNFGADYQSIMKIAGVATSIVGSNNNDDANDGNAIENQLSKVQEPNVEPKNSKKLYFEMFQLHPILITLSFENNFAIKDKRSGSTNNPLFQVLNSFSGIANIDGAELQLNALVLEDPYLSVQAMKSRLIKHYKRAVLQQFYVILGSFDLLGNPVGLFNDVSKGVFDFFYEPASAIVKGPKDFGAGLAKGTVSLLKNSMHGTANAASKMIGTLGNTMGAITLDDEYNKERTNNMRNKPKHVGEGIVGGIQAFGKGLVQGATGIVTKPVEGAKESGFGGFMQGIGKAVIGAPLKPLTGALDAATLITEGIKNTSRDAPAERVRKPRAFGKDGELVAFESYSAYGQELVWNIENGRYSKEKYVYHFVLDEKKEKCIVLTDTSVFECKGTQLLKWRLLIEEVEICIVSSMNSAIMFKTIKKGERSVKIGDKEQLAAEKLQQKLYEIKNGNDEELKRIFNAYSNQLTASSAEATKKSATPSSTTGDIHRTTGTIEAIKFSTEAPEPVTSSSSTPASTTIASPVVSLTSGAAWDTVPDASKKPKTPSRRNSLEKDEGIVRTSPRRPAGINIPHDIAQHTIFNESSSFDDKNNADDKDEVSSVHSTDSTSSVQSAASSSSATSSSATSSLVATTGTSVPTASTTAPISISKSPSSTSLASSLSSSATTASSLAAAEKPMYKTETIVEELYENQRKSLLGNYSAGAMTPLDLRGHWSDMQNQTTTSKDQISWPIGSGWKWTDEWTVERTHTPDGEDKQDKDGWEYAASFNSGHWSATNRPIYFVRRRKWRRTRERKVPVNLSSIGSFNSLGSITSNNNNSKK